MHRSYIVRDNTALKSAVLQRGKKEYSTFGRGEGKKQAHPLRLPLSSCLSSSAGILNTFLWDLLI